MLNQEQKRQSVQFKPQDLLAAAAMIAVGTQAYGEVIRFDNPASGDPGHFAWSHTSESDPLAWLDITRPSTDQGGGFGPTSIVQSDGSTGQSFHGGDAYIGNSGGFYYGLTDSFAAGALIDGSVTFEQRAYHYYNGASNLTASPNYIAVRFQDIDGAHYGWIGVTRNGIQLDAFAWAYETEAGVGIVTGAGVPVPGSLAALAFGAVVLRRSRNRKEVRN